MTILRDILEIFREIDGGKVENYLTTKKHASLSKSSSESTLQFPVICTRSIDLENMMMISKGLERNYGTFAQLVFANNPVFRIDGRQGMSQYIRQFHQNTDVRFDMSTDFINTLGPLLTESALLDDGELSLISIVHEGFDGSVVASNKEQMISLIDYMRQDIINEKFVPRIDSIYTNNTVLASRFNTSVLEKATKGQRRANARGGYTDNRSGGDNNRYQYEKVDSISNFTNADNSSHLSGNAAVNRIEHNVEKQYVTNKYIDGEKVSTSNGGEFVEYQLPRNILQDNEVKKSNELVPTLLRLKVILANNDGDMQQSYEFTLGVKAHLHPVNSDEMVKNLVSACRNNNKVFDFIRWTTGEISFFKDFIFSIDEMKDDVVSKSKGASPWWSLLKRRKALAKIKNRAMLGNRLLPNSTIVVSAEEVEYIKSEYGYDLMDKRIVKKIMDTYFLLGFVILDPSTEIAYIMFDGNVDFHTITFDGLNRENSNSRNVDTKEIIKLMNRM